ncbi:phage protein [Ligilactobacillus salitolerans]|uniref:Phage protein n=1 Tax=Ligilactobacillus salitolerans TaxID=1808352 RepID=A0A401ITY9_9LACO|nr:HK97-gp10 family putative phage morphogenesis protein [Ligilactobacillus salitolerans]GBG94976.1 phage protein [Ligilactobacillus salitolerans]
MSVEGEAEMLLNVDNLTKGFERRARSAVREGAQDFADQLQANTPVSDEDHSGLEHLAAAVKVAGVSTKTGNYSADIGYDKTKGPIAHFPNSGTSKQDPQHFVEKTQSEMRTRVLEDFIKNLRVGD